MRDLRIGFSANRLTFPSDLAKLVQRIGETGPNIRSAPSTLELLLIG